uniref:G-protein coupled receptors family 1 profile domain-containing protein n=1 Tax=Amazona collaria TaxID=241587 RepID=A0A8B9F8A4_9PSIT
MLTSSPRIGLQIDVGNAKCAVGYAVNATAYCHRKTEFNTSSSPDDASLHYFTNMKMFLIPPVVCLMAGVLIIPTILSVIFCRFSIRRETRYMLLGNALLFDLIYLLFYTLSSALNAAHVPLPKEACVLLLFLLAVTYCGGLFTAAAIVLDTYIAVLFPLRYIAILPPSRAKKVIVLLWVCAGAFPGIFFLVLSSTHSFVPCALEMCSVPVILILTPHGTDAVKLCFWLSTIVIFLCLALIFCCYVTLYFKTKQSGIWESICSRASVTFLMHNTVLFFYFFPLMALFVESFLCDNVVVKLGVGVWVSLTVCNVLMILPKVLFPFLYGLRYREISASLKSIVRREHLHLVLPAPITILSQHRAQPQQKELSLPC